MGTVRFQGGIVNGLRRVMLETADKVALSVQNVAKVFAFSSSGRDLVEETELSDGPGVCFPDHADEGWPGFTAPLPRNAQFSHAVSGPLTRAGFWKVGQSQTHVLDELGGRADAPDFAVGPTGADGAGPGDSRMRVSGIQSGSLIVIKQERDPDMIVEVMRRRAERMSSI